MVGIDPASDGLARARRLGVATTAEGVDGLVALPEFADVEVVFDATSAGAHRHNARCCGQHGKLMIDLTPAAIGPYVVPPVNLDEHLDETNVNMVTCGGQATIPIVAAVVAPGHPGRVRGDRRLDRLEVGRARHPGQHRRVHRDDLAGDRGGRRRRARQGDHRPQPGRAAADHARHRLLPCRTPDCRRGSDRRVGRATWWARCSEYVPGYRLKQDVQFDRVDGAYVPRPGPDRSRGSRCRSSSRWPAPATTCPPTPATWTS